MKTYLLSLIGLLYFVLLLCSCTRKEFFLSDCNQKYIPPYVSTDPRWAQLDSNIMKKYKRYKPKIVDGANGVIIYKSLPRHRQTIENIICEYWRSN